MISNPWKGLVSYVEADIDRYQFCGRTKAIGKYYSLLTNSLVSTLYGRTGCGKTSMLQAGIFPLLRQESFFPVMCRASLRKACDSFADYLIERIEQEIDELGFWYTKSNVPVEHVGDNDKYKLWKYFYGHEFKDGNGNIVFPVIVLDQFEEILIDSKDDALKLLEQIHILVGDDLLLPDDCYANFRVTISLREDYLYLLEDTIEYGKLNALRDNRMRLSPLSSEEALEVISLGDDFMLESDRNKIYETILKLSGNRRGHISTNMLSLICSQIYQLYDSRNTKTRLSVNDVEILAEDPLKDFYLKSVDGLKEETVSYIEKNLVDKERRGLVTIDDFKANVPDESEREKLTTGNTKILQIIVASDNECVELLHDTLAKTVYNIAEGKRKITQIQKRLLRVESVIVPLLSGCFAMDMILNNSSVLSVIFFVLILLFNWLFSVSSYGNKNISNWCFFIFLIISASISLMCFSETPSDDGFWFDVESYGLIYAVLFPIINLVRKNSDGPKLDLLESIKYIYGFKFLKDNKELFDTCVMPLCITSILTVAVICGFFMSTIGLWILMPICSLIFSYMLYKCFDKNVHINSVVVRLGALLLLTVAFVLLQYFVIDHNKSCGILAICFLVWSLSYIKLLENASWKQKTICVMSQFVMCGILLPILFLGYNPLKFDSYARNFKQPKVSSSEEIRIPLLSLHNEEGLNALADRKNMIFKADFMQIDSVNYDCFSWMLQNKQLDYKILSSCLDNPTSEDNDIVIYTEYEKYSWNKRYLSRADSEYLRDRIFVLENKNCGEWTEEEFADIAELSAAYMTIGDTIKAKSLEVNYFLRRMIQAEIYQSVGTSYRHSSKVCENMIDYYVGSKNNSKYGEQNYQEKFIRIADSCAILRDRVDKYIKSLKDDKEEDKTLKGKEQMLPLKDLANVDMVSLTNQLKSYCKNPIEYSMVESVIRQSEEMLYQTRESIGPYVLDSLYVPNYDDEIKNAWSYNNSCAWYNLFLCRFSKAEQYAGDAFDILSKSEEEWLTSDSNTYYNKYFPLTNLVASLYLQGRTKDALDLLVENKDSVAMLSLGDFGQLFFPLQASKRELSLGECVCQDINCFVQTGILRDITTIEEFRKELEFEFSLISDEGHMCYHDGWNLWEDSDATYQFINADKRALPLICNVDANIHDSIAICKLQQSGLYRFLDMRNMTFIGDEYDYAWHFSEGLAAVEKSGKIGFINKLGETEINYQYLSGKWLRKDHYRLAFHNNKVAVIDNDDLYYVLKNREGEYEFNGIHLPNLKWNANGIIAKTEVKGEDWVTATPNEGYIRKTFNAEIEDIVVDVTCNDTIPIYHHYDIRDIKLKQLLPETNISGIWYCDINESFLYLGKYTSDYMWVGECKDSGTFYLSLDKDNTYMHMLSRDSVLCKYMIEEYENVCYVYNIDGTYYCTLVKIKKM